MRQILTFFSRCFTLHQDLCNLKLKEQLLGLKNISEILEVLGTLGKPITKKYSENFTFLVAVFSFFLSLLSFVFLKQATLLSLIDETFVNKIYLIMREYHVITLF